MSYSKGPISPLTSSRPLLPMDSRSRSWGLRGIIPDYVQVWMFGDHYLVKAIVPVNPDSSYSFTVDPDIVQ